MELDDLESLLHLAYCVISCGLIRILMTMDINKYFSKQIKLEGAPSFMERRLWGGFSRKIGFSPYWELIKRS